MKYNPLDGDRAANYYDSLPEKEKEGIMSLDEALQYCKPKNICQYCAGNGDYPETGMFSKRIRCEKCGGTGRKKKKIKKEVFEPTEDYGHLIHWPY